jgi:Ca-activated chloride channel family protein
MRGERLDKIKMATIELIRQLRPQDMLSVVVFNDRAETLQAAGSRQSYTELGAQVQMLKPGGGTEIFRGLEAGFFEVRRSLRNKSVNHLILLTDGRTYGDEADCLKLAEDASSLGIGLTCLGIGGDWNDALLDRMAACTGGNSVYISHPAEIGRLFHRELDRLRQSRAGRVDLNLHIEPGVELVSVFRLTPEAIPLPVRSSIPLGGPGPDAHLAVMLEFILPALAQNQYNFPLASGRIRFSLPGQEPASSSLAFQLWRPAQPDPEPESPPDALIQVLSQLNLYWMQERARHELAEGRLEAATHRLQNLATNLLTRGELELAQAVLEEANRLQQGLPISAESKKRIKYGTRALLLPGTDRVQKD